MYGRIVHITTHSLQCSIINALHGGVLRIPFVFDQIEFRQTIPSDNQNMALQS